MNAVAHPELALSRKPLAVVVQAELLDRQTSMTKAIALCVQLSGLEPKEVCMTLEIDPGHWTRIMGGDAHFPTNKLGALMDCCGNEAPLLWLAHSRGKGLVLLKSEAERRAEVAEHNLASERAKVAMLTEILAGRRAA